MSDRGSGVEDSERKRIFAPFEQGRSLQGDKPDGMGLGLYEAASIAKRHGGSLQHQHRKGGGSRFVLRLPDTRAGTEESEKDVEVAHA